MILGSSIMEENVYELLKSFNLCDSNFNKVNYRTGIYNANPEYLVYRITGEYNLTKDKLVQRIYEIICKCDLNNQNYDSNLCEEVTRICLETDKIITEKPSLEELSPNEELIVQYENFEENFLQMQEGRKL